jgi:hypothetical protein
VAIKILPDAFAQDADRMARFTREAQVLAALPMASLPASQVTPGAPWQFRMTDELRARIVQQAPPDYLPMLEATIKLGVSRQTV